MGSCVNKEVKVKKQNNKKNATLCENVHLYTSEHYHEFEKFKDMPEWEGERYKGVGIKKMKGYICTIPINELNNLREDFWNYKIRFDPIWRQIKQAVIMDEGNYFKYNYFFIVRCTNLLKSLNLTCLSGCVNKLVDQNSHIYKIPNFCINDPYFEKIIKSDSDSFNDSEPKLINLNLYDLYNNKKCTLEVYDKSTGKEIKENFLKSINLNPATNFNKIRLFFGGSEILDDHKLYKHNIKNDYTVQIMNLINENKTT